MNFLLHHGTHLALDQHGHVDEHVVQLTDAVFQLDDLSVPGLDLVQGLLRHLRVHFDLRGRFTQVTTLSSDGVIVIFSTTLICLFFCLFLIFSPYLLSSDFLYQ